MQLVSPLRRPVHTGRRSELSREGIQRKNEQSVRPEIGLEDLYFPILHACNGSRLLNPLPPGR